MKIFICGFSGAGKSSLLDRLSQHEITDTYELIDLDAFIEKKERRSIVEIFESDGERYFRKAELQALEEFNLKENVIVALGGGTLRSESLPVLVDWKGYFLSTDFKTCWNRILNDPTRPLVLKGKEHLRQLYNERVKFYANYEKISSLEDLLKKIIP